MDKTRVAVVFSRLSVGDAVEKAKTETRQYAKRQSTWLKSNMITWKQIDMKESKRNFTDIFSLI